MNIAQFGNNLYGVETAAQRYFSVSAADLNVVQSATIAAITRTQACMIRWSKRTRRKAKTNAISCSS